MKAKTKAELVKIINDLISLVPIEIPDHHPILKAATDAVLESQYDSP